MGKLMSFVRKSRSKNSIIAEIVPNPTPPLPSNFLTKYWREIFIFFLIIRISSVPIFLSLLLLRHFGIKM